MCLYGDLEVGVKEQVAEFGVLVVGFFDLAQKCAADYAAAPPHEGYAAIVQIPAVGLCGCAHEGIALCVGYYLGGEQRLPYGLDELFFVPIELRYIPSELLRGDYPLFLHGGEAAGEYRLAYEGQRHALVQRGYAGPLACALLACGIQYLFNDGAAVGILVGEYVAGYLDEVRVKLRLVPLFEYLVHLVVAHPEQVPHEVVRFADELHIAVLYAVMYHLYEVARAVFSNPVAAGGVVLYLCADGLEYGLYVWPCGRGAAGHHAGAFQCAFFSAGNACAYVQLALGFHIRGAAYGIRKVAVASIYEYVAVIQEG